MSRALTYPRYELLRTLRNRRFFFLSLAFPLILYYLIAAPNRHLRDLQGTGLGAPLYFMVGLVSFGTMAAMLSSGARIASERAVGWNRQLRVTPLRPFTYFCTKVLTGYMVALISICALYLAGATLGVSIAAGRWLEMTGLILVGLIPFAALGILIGHLLTPDSVGPAIGGGIALLAILGGTWGPIARHGFLHTVAQLVPSYWLVQAAHVAGGGSAWPAKGWAVIAVWTIVAARLAQRAYRRDTSRV